MNRCCITCKWYYKQKCNCKDLNMTAITKDDGTKYVEDGLLSANIEENVLTKDIINMVVEKLQEQDYIKKNKSIKNFNDEDLERELIETIDDKLSYGIMNYFYGESDDIEINNPDTFSCCYWE